MSLIYVRVRDGNVDMRKSEKEREREIAQRDTHDEREKKTKLILMRLLVMITFLASFLTSNESNCLNGDIREFKRRENYHIKCKSKLSIF